ncbi:MAG TPA: SDR family oxidoreductase [Bacteroidia bacterium]|nr:SDR family oxidoreductase [Bacteroidia bacterium]
MKKVILFGGTGKLGRRVAIELQRQKYDVTAVVRNHDKAAQLKNIVNQTIVADVCKAEELKNICNGFDIIVSTLGKSVSPKDNSKPSFMKVDMKTNCNILREGISASVKKFVYVSAFGAENNLNLNYFRAHHIFSEKLKCSGMNYSIIKPPAIFSSFVDLMEMAKKGRLLTLGAGDKLTNPIYEGDLAEICVNSIVDENVVIEAGGKNVYTRKQINDLIQQHVKPGQRVMKMPIGLLSFGVSLIKLFDSNAYDKFAFYLEVMRHDLIALKMGETSLEKYLSEKLYLE